MKVVRFDQNQIAELAILDQPLGVLGQRAEPAMVAHVALNLRLLHRFDHPPAIFQVDRHGLFQIDVLACLS